MAEEAADQAPKGPMPPYIAFKTLTDLVERMEREEPPTRIDTTYLESYAGGYRPTVIGNLQNMGLLAKSGEPTQVLLDLVKATEAERKPLVAALIRSLYPDILALPSNSTQGQFLEAFANRGAAGDTRRKAISFFLKACAYAGVEVGKHWKTPAASSTGARKRATRDKGAATDEVQPLEQQAQPPATSSGEVVTVNLGEAGKVVLNVDVKWLQLDDDTFTALRQAVKDITALAAANEPAPADTAGAPDEPEEVNEG